MRAVIGCKSKMSPPRILITHESSGVVREAFRALGCDAWSCDLQPADDRSPFHYKCDVRELDLNAWDMVGMHPSCQYLCGSGIHWNNRGRGWSETEAALDHVRWLMSHRVRFYLENPVGIISTRIQKPDQIIQPYQFGEDASKFTCLWLNDLPPLEIDPAWRFPGRMVEWPRGSGKLVERWSNQTDSGMNKLPPSELRWKERSRTYPKIAAIMARQWTEYLCNPNAHTVRGQLTLPLCSAA